MESKICYNYLYGKNLIKVVENSGGGEVNCRFTLILSCKLCQTVDKFANETGWRLYNKQFFCHF